MISETKTMTLKDGETLSVNIVENGSPVWIIASHGLGEHAGRHLYLYKLFSQYFNICIYDLRGHGKSSGKRAYVKNFSTFIDDLGQVVDYLKNNYSMKRHIMFGHSMGGLIVASYMQNYVTEENYPEKVFLSAPASCAGGNIGKVLKVAPTKLMKSLCQIPATLAVEGVLDIAKLSHDPRNYESYITDDLNSMKVHTHLFLEILHEARKVFSRPLRVKCDLYCGVGSKDIIVGTDNTIEYFKTIEKNAKLKVIEGGYHELHNEIEKYRGEYLEFLKASLLDEAYA